LRSACQLYCYFFCDPLVSIRVMAPSLTVLRNHTQTH